MNCEQYKTLVKNVLSGLVMAITSLAEDPGFNFKTSKFLIDYLNDCITLVERDMFDQLSTMRNKGKTEIGYLSSFGGTDTYLRGLCTSMAKQIRAITTNAADSLANKKRQGLCHTTLSDRDLGASAPDCGFMPTSGMREHMPEFNQPQKCISDMIARSKDSQDMLAINEISKMTLGRPINAGDVPMVKKPPGEQKLWTWKDFEPAPIPEPVRKYAPLKAQVFCSTPTDTVLNQRHNTCVSDCLACKYNILHCKMYCHVRDCCRFLNCMNKMCLGDYQDIHGLDKKSGQELFAMNYDFKVTLKK